MPLDIVLGLTVAALLLGHPRKVLLMREPAACDAKP